MLLLVLSGRKGGQVVEAEEGRWEEGDEEMHEGREWCCSSAVVMGERVRRKKEAQASAGSASSKVRFVPRPARKNLCHQTVAFFISAAASPAEPPSFDR